MVGTYGYWVNTSNKIDVKVGNFLLLRKSNNRFLNTL